ncbi:MAG: anaerobic ribonucleoside-triphosphate reductase activating protein [Oscillospiraceae bacterium]|nr:anaerobic ribonucleoside-triphosphate reductase activating protein [Oscillospiraceae bacterium]
MNYATIKNCDIANGPGVRVSLFVSGCTHRCKGCFNEVAWDFQYGEPFTQQTVDLILQMVAPDYVQGITLLGGEPFEPQNQPEILNLLRQMKEKYPHKNVWAFSGYLFDQEILSQKLGPWEITKEILGYVDVLVDGRFVLEKKDLSLRFRGSSNQRIIDVPASLKTGDVVLWEDWQGHGKGMK